MIAMYAITEPPAPHVVGARTVVAAGLVAIVREVDAPPEPAHNALLEHERIVEAAMVERVTLPVRFGTTLASEAAAREHLEHESARYRAMLDAVRGCVELSVRARGVDAAPAAPSDGLGYVEARLHALAAERAVHEPLERFARSSTRAGASFAYLVPASRVGDFADRVRALQDEHPEYDLSCTGPWPPYSFVGAT